jgi:hypothetical protein
MLQTQGKGNHTLYSYRIIHHSSSHLLPPQIPSEAKVPNPQRFQGPIAAQIHSKSKPSFSSTRSLVCHIWTIPPPPPPPRTYTARVCERGRLDLLSTPTPIRFAHVLWRLNTGDELEHHVNQADYPNDSAEDDVHGVVLEQDGAAEDVNCGT